MKYSVYLCCTSLLSDVISSKFKTFPIFYIRILPIFKNASAFLLRDARHAMHDILLLRISAILPEAISDGGLTPTTDTDLLLATYRGGSHLTSDIHKRAGNPPALSLSYIFSLTIKSSYSQILIINIALKPHICLKSASYRRFPEKSLLRHTNVKYEAIYV